MTNTSDWLHYVEMSLYKLVHLLQDEQQEDAAREASKIAKNINSLNIDLIVIGKPDTFEPFTEQDMDADPAIKMGKKILREKSEATSKHGS